MIKLKRKNALSVQKETGLQSSGDTSSEDGKGSPGPPDVDDEDAELSETEENDCKDATSARLLSKKQQHASYEGPGASDDEAMGVDGDGFSSEEDKEDVKPVLMRGKAGKKEVKREDSDSEEEMSEGDSVQSVPPPDKYAAMDMERVHDVLRVKGGSIVDYRYDTAESLWCKATLRVASLDAKVMLTSVIQKVATKSVVWETPNIRKGFLSESTEPGDAGIWHLKTDGVNLQELWRHECVLDLNRAYTNNIHAMASVYGIEAAANAIIREISGVFRVYGIAVDYRHLSLIADYMTYEGCYKPFNRIGMETNSSPLQKMSFETTMQFLKNATIAGERDPILSPSACLVTGRVVRGGTGCIDLLQKLY